MPNIELLEKSTPVAPVRIAALAGCQDLANEVDKKLVKFRKELVAKKKPSQIPQGYSLPSFLVDSEIHPVNPDNACTIRITAAAGTYLAGAS